MIARLSSACALIAVSFIVSGCTSTNTLPPKAISGLNDISSSVASATNELKQTHTALEAVTKATTNVPAAIKSFEGELAQLTQAVNDARTTREANLGEPKEFFNEWKRQIDEMSNAELQAASRERFTKVKATLTPVQTKIDLLREGFRPHYKDLQELATALNNDPTPSGVTAIQPNIERIIRQGKEVVKLSENLQSEIRRVTQ